MKTIHCPMCDKSRPQAGSTVRLFLGLRRRVCGKCGKRLAMKGLIKWLGDCSNTNARSSRLWFSQVLRWLSLMANGFYRFHNSHLG